MAKVSTYTGSISSPLIRLFAQVAGMQVRPSKVLMSDRLSQWLSWTDAIALSAALEGPTSRSMPDPQAAVCADGLEVARVRATLTAGIADEGALKSSKAQGPAPVEFGPYRQRYLSLQQSMEFAIGTLRGRLRTTLTARSPALARLAALDAVMTPVLGAREQSVLSTLPILLEGHFQRLRQAGDLAVTNTHPPNTADGADVACAWLGVFCRDMRAMLLAELDLRFQPVEGLIEALHMTSSGHHE